MEQKMIEKICKNSACGRLMLVKNNRQLYCDSCRYSKMIDHHYPTKFDFQLARAGMSVFLFIVFMMIILFLVIILWILKN